MTVDELLSGIDLAKHPGARSIAENACWMEQRLAESREAIRTAPIVMPYDNGGGQTGIRKNPMYDAYEALLASYIKAVSQLDAMVDSADGEDGEDGESPLQLLINRRRIINVANTEGMPRADIRACP